MHTLLTDMKITVPLHEKENGVELLKRFRTNAKQRIKRHLKELSFEERMTFAEEEAGMTFFTNCKDDVYRDYLRRLLTEASNKKEEENGPIGITYTLGGITKEGYTLLGDDIKTKYHKGNLKIGNTYDPVLVVDFNGILADIIVNKEYKSFIVESTDYVQFLFAKRFYLSYDALPFPEDPEFSTDLKAVYEKHGMYKEEQTVSEYLNKFKPYFYAEDESLFFQKFMVHTVVPSWLQHLIKEGIDREHAEKHARANETKKNRTKQTEKRMEETPLLSHFLFVEYDDDVKEEQLDRFEEAADLFIKTFSWPVPEGITFRIKKLGRHRAEGIWFPWNDNLVVDVNHTHSFVHEFAHMLDYRSGTSFPLSEHPSFEAIKNQYQAMVEESIEALPKDDERRKRWNGTTKYNRNYYLQPTEIFARSFELYYGDKGISSEILPEQLDEIYYPNDALFKTRVENYFEKLKQSIVSQEGFGFSSLGSFGVATKYK
ncbi:hypothetical protein IMZ31_19640 (plasmid) [Pontibacillus sp. ALD_SL1]|uniref:hypothetical protein n=1 Tax=Pontibacillus sp. ALD_SL1 TaxID=2777185 RepID=UPI001A965820|nr:hypothetical protein [Pontibacillus sp. ALD_SL1]QST02765.1 hypothetical protein IMZ31_19640 [Pontibacillus sp. ALD_SL1]